MAERPATGQRHLAHRAQDGVAFARTDGPHVLSAAALAQRLEDADVVGDRGAAHVEHAADLGLGQLQPPGALPLSCIAVITCMLTPVAPTGWPLAFSPPETLTGSLPSRSTQPSWMARSPSPGAVEAHRLVFDQLGRGEAVVALDEREVEQVELASASACFQASAGPSNLMMSRLLIGRKSLTCCGGAEGDRLLHAERRADIGQHHGGRAVGHRRAVGALQRARDERVLVRRRAAELVGEFLLEMRVGVLGAVLVRLDRDLGERIGLVAVALEIGRGDLAEDAGEARLDVGFLGDVARP